MNFVYYKFLFINTLKRKPIWITWFLFLFTCTCFIIILPLVAEMNTLQVWANTTMAVCQTFMGMVASLFTAVLAINIFKDTNEEGTELIVISKPITRFKIVLTKFFVFGTYCLMINLTAVLLSIFTVFLPRTEPQFYAGLVLSMFIGNAITFMVFGSISILLTVKFAKMGVIITNIIISLIFLIYQTLTLFVFSTPIRALDSKKMSAPSYIVLDRKSDGTYKEREVVRFTPSDIPEGTVHPCHATNWQEMKQFWEQDIKSLDPTPTLNATDLAGQLGLTYMSYQTDKYAERQANRMFGISRFYDYKLTSPASPEIISGVEHKQTLNWIYTDFANYDDYWLPSAFGFAGIEPLTGTRLRGYTNKIPVGSMRSKKLLFSTETYFEPKDWVKYQAGFDEMYVNVLDYKNYDFSGMDYSQYTSAFGATNANINTYYNLVWQYLMGKSGTHDYDIKTVQDLNTRFIQFKNYCYWKALDEQQDALNNVPESGAIYDSWNSARTQIQDKWLLVGVNLSSNSWMMMDNSESEVHLLDPNTQAPCYDWLNTAWSIEKQTHTDVQFGLECPLSIVLKTAQVFNTIVYTEENYMYSSLESSSRTSDYSGRVYTVKDSWYPYINGIIGEIIPINMPLGQNMQYFFYETTAKVQYWIYAIIWGVISMCAFAAGAIVYNKYDVK